MIDSLRNERLKKLAALEKQGINAYPARVKRTHTLSEVIEGFTSLSRTKKKCTVVGRVWGLRKQGSLLFIDLKDESGSIQLVLKKDKIKDFAFIRSNLDLGDFVNVVGTLFKTKKGEKSIEVTSLTFVVKALRPIPSEWYGLEDQEIRFRKRYLDILINKGTKELFEKKAKFWNSMRQYLTNEGFLEMQASALENVPGGADATPFVTHHDALNTDFYLRISLELPLKRLLVAGYENVFEIGRIFRNEGIDAEHLQDYMQMEMYWAYHDYHDLMKFLEKLHKYVIKETVGTLTTNYNGKKINWGKVWPRLEYTQLFKKHTGLDPRTASKEILLKKARSLKIESASAKLGIGRLIDLIYKKTVRPHLIQPAFLINPPTKLAPLSKQSESDPNVVERFWVVACGTELGTGWSELNDPVEQRRRFEEQMKLRKAGDKEAQMIDEDYLEAMEYGMPPNAGFGVSERLFSVLVDKPVRETTLFPLMKPKK